MNRKALQKISYGMYVVATVDESTKKPYGCIINTVSQVTSENPVICFHLNKENATTTCLLQSKQVAISILSTKTDPNLIASFGFRSSHEVNKFEGVSLKEIDGLPVVEEHTTAYLTGKVIQTVDVGSHITFFVQVEKCDVLEEEDMMTYEYYHKVIKGRAPKKAPTYQQEDAGEEVFVCDVCGYRVKGKPGEDFICPICGMPYTHFQKEK